MFTFTLGDGLVGGAELGRALGTKWSLTLSLRWKTIAVGKERSMNSRELNEGAPTPQGQCVERP
jgi:hypothetical protein